MANAANIVKLKRSAVAGKAPNTADLQLGELALNTYDGRLFFTTTQDSGSTYNLTTLQPFPTGGSSGQVLSLDSYGNLIWSTTSGTGTVTSVSVVSANGFTGTVATSGTTPAITIATSVTGLLKGNGTSISAATASTDYVIPSDLSSYVTSTSLSSTLGSYVTGSSLSSTLSSYVTSSSLSSTLSSYVTSSTLSSYNYISLTSLSTDTPGTASGTGSIAYDNATGKFKYTPPDLSSYVTSTSLSSTLGSYVTSTSLSSTLGNYVTSTSLSSTLGSYVTSTSLSSTLSSYVTSSTLSSYNYITLASLSMDTPASASGSGNVQYDSATGKFKYTPPDLSSYITASVATLSSLTSIGTTGVDTTAAGNLIVSGNLTVNGTTETINSTTSTFADKNIELAKPVSPATASDSGANGGGITLHGTTDKTLNWVLSTLAWTSSENFDIANNKTYKINGTDVLSSTALGSGVTGSSLTSVGTITSGTWHGTAIANSYLANSTIVLNGVTLTLGDTNDTIKASTTNALTIGTGLSGTSFDGSSAVTIALATGYGDTQNPYASKTAKYILAAPNSTNGAPTFRALVASDIPTLNQDTTGNAGTVTNGVYTTGSYADPGWITSLSQTKVLPTQTSNNGFYLTTNGTTATWTAFPTASTTQLGGVKVDGTTITINNGVISSAGSGGSLTTSSFDYWAGILIMG